MGSVQCVCFLFTILLFLTYLYMADTNVVETEKARNPEDEMNNKSVNSIGLSADHFEKAVKFIKESKFYHKIQDVLVHYIQHFVMYGKMTMRTESGKITVPLSDKIERNLSIMVKHILHLEHTFTAIKNETFDFTSQVNKFRFIRNNTVLFDKVIEQAEASFKAHGDIENPKKLSFYNTRKSEERFFNMEHLNQSIKDILQIQKDAALEFFDFATGRLFGSKSSDLNSDECLHIGEYASTDNVSHSLQFYEAAVKRLDTHEILMINKSQILEKIILFYTQYGPQCEHRVSKLRDELEKVQVEERESKAAEEDDEEEEEMEETVKETNDEKEDEKDGKIKQQKNKGNNKDETTDANEEKSEGKSNPANDNNDIDGKTEDKDTNGRLDATDYNVDKNDEICFRQIMKSSVLSPKHDEL